MPTSKKLLALSFSFALLIPQISIAADNNGGAGPADVTTGSEWPNQGHIICTAAINSNGTVATRLVGSYINPTATTRLSTGTYQVGFGFPCQNVQSRFGWFRIVQPDTLTDGTLPARSCTVADRSGVANAIWVQCFDAGGALVDTSFTISVSK